MGKSILTGLLFLTFFSLHAQGVTGKWRTIDDQSGKAKSIVKIYEQDGKIYGKVTEILNPARKDAVCKECTGADKDKPVEGMVIIRGLEKEGDESNRYNCADRSRRKNRVKLVNRRQRPLAVVQPVEKEHDQNRDDVDNQHTPIG